MITTVDGKKKTSGEIVFRIWLNEKRRYIPTTFKVSAVAEKNPSKLWDDYSLAKKEADRLNNGKQNKKV